MIQCFDYYQLTHYYREGNKVVDSLANMSRDLAAGSLQLHQLDLAKYLSLVCMDNNESHPIYDALSLKLILFKLECQINNKKLSSHKRFKKNGDSHVLNFIRLYSIIY